MSCYHRDQLRRIFKLPSFIPVEYKKHQESLTDQTSYRNPSMIHRPNYKPNEGQSAHAGTRPPGYTNHRPGYIKSDTTSSPRNYSSDGSPRNNSGEASSGTPHSRWDSSGERSSGQQSGGGGFVSKPAWKGRESISTGDPARDKELRDQQDSRGGSSSSNSYQGSQNAWKQPGSGTGSPRSAESGGGSASGKCTMDLTYYFALRTNFDDLCLLRLKK
jgi:hypothetical protein